jgi:hypothetical protein
MSRFPLFEAKAPKVGQELMFQRMLGELTKPSPAHISLVGPRYSGKTVLLRALESSVRSPGDHYQAVIYWDLGHGTPRTDDVFLTSLRKHIAEAIRPKNQGEAEYLDEPDAGYDELHEVLSQLSQNEARVLMIWDGFDRPLNEGSLTRNLWDNLLELCRMSSFRAVTGSRRRLRELIRDKDSVTSDFWGVFDSMSLAVMGADDVEAFASCVPDHHFEPGALKEILNWSGGIPLLVAWLMNRVAEHPPSESISSELITRLARERDDKCQDALGQIWSDCDAPQKDLFRLLVESGPQKTSSLPKAQRFTLSELGLGVDQGGSFRANCRMLIDYIEEEGPEFGALARLFGSWEDYSKNIRGILERRLSHIERFDGTLFHMVERAIEDIPQHPGVSLASLSQIEDRALELIWEWECDADGFLPNRVIADWSEIAIRLGTKRRNQTLAEMMDADVAGHSDAYRIPTERYKQLALLQLLTGSHQDYNKSLARHVTKDAYALLNALHSFRNRSEHKGGQDVPIGTAISALMVCIEMLACMQDKAVPAALKKDATSNSK